MTTRMATDQASAIFESRSRAAMPPPAPRGAFVFALRWVVQARRRARENEELAQLDDRLLRDIGVTRAEFAGARDTPWWRSWCGLS